MIRQRNTSEESGRIGILHRAGRQWRVLIGELDGRRPEVVAAREFPAETSGAIEAWLDEQQVTQIMCVLPASTYICRTCVLPDVPPDAIEQTLNLQVEAHLPDVVPGHRIGAAALETASGEANRSGILIAWPESSRFAAPFDSDDIRYVPDVAALAALMNGERPADPLMAVDPAQGSIAIALTHANGAAFRAAKDSGESAVSWNESVGRVVAETALSVNHSGPFIESIVQMAKEAVRSAGDGESMLMLPSETRDSARRRVHGASLEESWWSKYGVAVGALLARAGELNGLTQLELAPPAESPSRIDALVNSLARPRSAVFCAIACLLLLAFGPLALHGTRLAVLKLRHGDLDARMAEYDKLMAKREMYQDLQREGWPVTKLLSDLTTNTPPGIELESINFTHGDSLIATGRSIPHEYPPAPDGDKWSENYPTGRQDGMANIATMNKNLSSSNIFTNVTFTTREPNAYGHYEFTVQADIVQPFYDRQYPVDWDFAKWTMQQRVDEVGPGEMKYPDADATASAAATSEDVTGSTTRFDTPVPAAGSSDLAGVPVAESQSPGPEAIAVAPTTGDFPTTSPGLRTSPPRNARRPIQGTGGAGNSTGDAADRSVPGERAGAGVGPAFEVPETLTQDQINAMNHDQVMDYLAKIAQAEMAVKGKDEELHKQLGDQRRLLFARLRELDSQQ